MEGTVPVPYQAGRPRCATICRRCCAPLLSPVAGWGPPTPSHPHAHPTHTWKNVCPLQELLRAFALSRGWVGPSGLPDETRCSRRILKDYVDGKLLFCKPPPWSGLEPYTGKAPAPQQHTQQAQRQLGGPLPGAATERSGQDSGTGEPDGAAAGVGGGPAGAPAAAGEEGDGGAASSHEEGLSSSDEEGAEGTEADGDVGDLRLNAADLDLLEGMELPGGLGICGIVGI